MSDFSVKVSIVIPAYNNMESFKRALESIFIQKFQDYEVVVTDDSSNNDIKEFLASADFIKQGVATPCCKSRVKYFKNPIQLGSPENWNESIRKANGEYIKILHHDDWFANENALGKFVKLLDKHPESDFGYAKSVDIDIETGKIKTRKAEKYVERLKKNCFELFLTNRIGAPSVTIFRNGKNLFFDKNLKWVVDMDFYLQCLINNSNLAFVNEVLINIGISNTQVTKVCENDQNIEIFEQFYLYDKYKSYLQDKKYQKELNKLIKKFKIQDINILKDILSEDIEIPENISKKLLKGDSWLKKIFRF